MECKEGRVLAKKKSECSLTFGEAVALVQKAHRGEHVVVHGSYTPRGMGLVTPAFTSGAQVVEVEVDKDTGNVDIKKIWTAHDCGTVINPRSVEGQIAGSIQMGLGYALSEQFVMEKGKTLNTTFLDYKMPAALDMPPSDSRHIECYEPNGPLGAKETGEGLASPTAPAIAEAVYHATGYRCKDLPLTPEKILDGAKRSAKKKAKR